jgi:hypothetical protein
VSARSASRGAQCGCLRAQRSAHALSCDDDAEDQRNGQQVLRLPLQLAEDRLCKGVLRSAVYRQCRRDTPSTLETFRMAGLTAFQTALELLNFAR